MQHQVTKNNEIRKFLVISLGQLAQPKMSETVSALADISARDSIFPNYIAYPFKYAGTLIKYGYDQHIGGNIDAYKTGQLNEDQFQNYLQDSISNSATKEHLTNAWNKMCTLSDTDKTNINALLNFLSENNVRAIIVSSTNPSQQKYIRDQIEEFDANGKLLNLENDDKIIYANSYEHNTLSTQTLAYSVLNKYSGGKVYSLHRDFNNDNNNLSSLGNENSVKPIFEFACNPFNPSKSPLSDHLVQAKAFFDAQHSI